jgi:uncharacterized protein (TIGR02453 family)
MFTGFDEKTTEFLWGIRMNNNRTWFLENKQTFIDHVQKPMGELGEEVWTYLTEQHKLDAGYRVARIYRDARRVKDGRPYKDNLWFTIQQDFTDGPEVPAFFFGIDPEGYTYGLGYYSAPAPTMKKFRDRLDLNPAAFERIALPLKEQKVFELYGDEYKQKKAEREGIFGEWYNRKNLGMIAERSGHKKITSPKFTKTLCEDFALLLPLYHFLWSIEKA